MIALVLLCCVVHTAFAQSGILINSQRGAQLYNPFTQPHGQPLQIGLQTGDNAVGAAAVIGNAGVAYFVSGGGGMSYSCCCFDSNVPRDVL
jgi:hypothetical protein